MGGKSSKAQGQPQPQKRASMIGRSSQRSIYQSSRKKIEKINKDLNKFKGTPYDDEYKKIKEQLEAINSELDTLSPGLKDKHKKSYDQVVQYLDNTVDKLDEMAENNALNKEPESAPSPRNHSEQESRKEVKLTLMKIDSVEDLTNTPPPSPEEVAKSPSDHSGEETGDEEHLPEEPASPTTKDPKRMSALKFGIKVMPHIAVNMLDIKLKGVRASVASMSNASMTSEPAPASPKPREPSSIEETFTQKPRRPKTGAEFDEFVALVDEAEQEIFKYNNKEVDQTYVNIKKSLTSILKKVETFDVGDNSGLKQEQKVLTNRIHELLSNLGTKMRNSAYGPVVETKKPTPFKRSSSTQRKLLHEVEEVSACLDEIENKIRTFKSAEIDEKYVLLKNSLAKAQQKLESVEAVEDNPVIKQEQKIALKRVGELLEALDKKLYENSRASLQHLHETALEPPGEYSANEVDYSEIDEIGSVIDRLEEEIRSFKSSDIDVHYLGIKNALIMNLIKLEHVDTKNNALVKLEQKTCTERIHDLMKLLEDKLKLLKTSASNANSESDDDTFYDLTDSKKKPLKKPLSTPL